MLFSELKCKDVINIRDCKKLGHVCDLEFDECSGCICKIMVPGGNQWLGFLRCEPNIVIRSGTDHPRSPHCSKNV